MIVSVINRLGFTQTLFYKSRQELVCRLVESRETESEHHLKIQVYYSIIGDVYQSIILPHNILLTFSLEYALLD